MNDLFKIYIDRLGVSDDEIINETFSPEFMEIAEKDLVFSEPVYVKGKASKTDDELFLDFSIKTIALIPCAICNNPTRVAIEIEHFSHSENLDEIRGGVFNFKDLIREAILLDVPLVTKCQGDNCPEQEHMIKYMKKNKMEEEKQSFHPFADL